MEQNARKGISEAVLKHVALITMLIDHVTAFLLKDYLRTQGIYQVYDSNLYVIGRVIGRIAFVLYAFMIAEGAFRTHSKIRYALRLLILALISIIPHSYVNAQVLFNKDDLNIFFLLFTGLLVIYAWDFLKTEIKNRALSLLVRLAVLAAACAISILCNFEYGMMGILLILVCHIYRYEFPKLALAVLLVNSVGYMANVVLRSGAVHWFAQHQNNLFMSLMNLDKIQIFGILALPFIYFYNGKKGRQLPKWFYYLFYPVHLGIIALILYL